MRRQPARIVHFAALLFLVLISSIRGDPNSLVLNGGFEIEYFVFQQFTQMTVYHNGEMNFIPFFQVVEGGVQLLDASEYQTNSVDPIANGLQEGSYLLHMNYEKGPGVLQTEPLITPRKGATYNFSFDMADNPDGGPLSKSLVVTVLVNDRFSYPRYEAFTVSNPFANRNSLEWNTLGFTFVGTGEPTILQFQSQVPGPLGPIIDNINVTLLSLLDNGSFETASDRLARSNLTYCQILEAPNALIEGWTVAEGKIKYCGNDRWESATDDSTAMLDLNAEASRGKISSDPFDVIPREKYKMMFDTAANPDSVPPITGRILAKAISSPGGKVLTSRSIQVSGAGFSPESVGWTTYMMEFEAEENMVVVEFVSEMEGSINGPLLDNVDVFQIYKPGRYTSLPRTYSNAAGGRGARAALTLSLVATVVVLCVLMTSIDNY